MQRVRSAAHETITPTESDSALARRGLVELAGLIDEGEDLELSFGEGKNRVRVELPAGALRLLKEILSEMAEGNSVALLPIQAELTTQEAADYLGVSRPFLVKLLDGGEVEHHRVGSHRRVRFRDLVAYERRMKHERLKTLDELSAQAQELDLGY